MIAALDGSLAANPRYFVMIGFGDAVGGVAAGEIASVSHAFQPEGRSAPPASLSRFGVLPVPAAAQSPQLWTQVGSLMCKVNPNIGFIIVGHQPMECTYTQTLAPAPQQYYDGAINTVGLDIGVSSGSVLGWVYFRRQPVLLPARSPANMSG